MLGDGYFHMAMQLPTELSNTIERISSLQNADAVCFIYLLGEKGSAVMDDVVPRDVPAFCCEFLGKITACHRGGKEWWVCLVWAVSFPSVPSLRGCTMAHT